MPAITVIRRRLRRQAERGPRGKHPKATLTNESGSLTSTFPFAPRVTSSGNIAGEHVQRSRRGRDPLLVRTGGSLRTLSFELVLDSFDKRSMETQLLTLIQLARRDERVRLSYGPSEAGWWRITGLNVDAYDRARVSQHITGAVLPLELTRAGDPRITTASGRPRPQRGAGGKDKPADRSPKPGRRSHVIAAGDSLFTIAQRYYNDGSKWRRILDANPGLKPRRLPVGKRIVIP